MIRRILTGGSGRKPGSFEIGQIEKAGQNALGLIQAQMDLTRALGEKLSLLVESNGLTLEVAKLGNTGRLTLEPESFIGDAVIFSLKAKCSEKMIGAHDEKQIESWRVVFEKLGLQFSSVRNNKGEVAQGRFIYSSPPQSILESPEQALKHVHREAKIAVHYDSLCGALGMAKAQVDEIRNRAMMAKAQELKVSYPVFLEAQQASQHR